jgi:hypothetical protein
MFCKKSNSANDEIRFSRMIVPKEQYLGKGATHCRILQSTDLFMRDCDVVADIAAGQANLQICDLVSQVNHT